METILIVICVAAFATAFALALFWIVAKTVGKIPVVKNSPTLDEVQDALVNSPTLHVMHDLMSPELAGMRPHSHVEDARNSESLSETVRALADAGDKLGAATTYKEESGVGLTEAKETIEAYLGS